MRRAAAGAKRGSVQVRDPRGILGASSRTKGAARRRPERSRAKRQKETPEAFLSPGRFAGRLARIIVSLFFVGSAVM